MCDSIPEPRWVKEYVIELIRNLSKWDPEICWELRRDYRSLLEDPVFTLKACAKKKEAKKPHAKHPSPTPTKTPRPQFTGKSAGLSQFQRPLPGNLPVQATQNRDKW